MLRIHRQPHSTLRSILAAAKVLLALLIAVPQLLSAAPLGSSGIDFVGKVSYTLISNGEIELQVEQIRSAASSASRSGSLRLELWALRTPYAGSGSISGYVLARVNTGQILGLSDQLAGGQAFPPFNVRTAVTSLSQSQLASYPSYVLFVSQYDSTSSCSSDHYCVIAYQNFILPTAAAATYTLTGRTVNEQGAPVAGSVVTIKGHGAELSGMSDANGNYSVAFNKTGFPDYIAVPISSTGYIPNVQQVNVKGFNASNAGTVTLSPHGNDVVVLEVVPDLHHLGDDSYSGSINSQFQKGSESSLFSKAFTVSSEQKAGSGATITFTLKGAQCNNVLRINNNAVGYMNVSPSSGAFGSYSFTNVPMSYFTTGTNMLTIQGVPCTPPDIDDFEFVNVVIKFGNVSPGNVSSGSGGSTGSSTTAPVSGQLSLLTTRIVNTVDLNGQLRLEGTLTNSGTSTTGDLQVEVYGSAGLVYGALLQDRVLLASMSHSPLAPQQSISLASYPLLYTFPVSAYYNVYVAVYESTPAGKVLRNVSTIAAASSTAGGVLFGRAAPTFDDVTGRLSFVIQEPDGKKYLVWAKPNPAFVGLQFVEEYRWSLPSSSQELPYAAYQNNRARVLMSQVWATGRQSVPALRNVLFDVTRSSQLDSSKLVMNYVSHQPY